LNQFVTSQDMGSGQGHLARALTFCCNIPVLAVECNGDLLKMAAKFDDEASYSLSKYLKKVRLDFSAGEQSLLTEFVHINWL